jgi:hypothetical protein
MYWVKDWCVVCHMQVSTSQKWTACPEVIQAQRNGGERKKLLDGRVENEKRKLRGSFPMIRQYLCAASHAVLVVY